MTPLHIVAIGGGTGLSTLLHGLKRFALEPREIEITAIVTVSDDGGSSGRLRREFDVLPPGDIRNCMVALSEDEALLSRLFQYRFPGGRGLKGHSFGNLFLTALTNLTGDFVQAIKVSSEVLASLGRIYPATNANVVLEAELENGTVVKGETRIGKSRSRIRRIRLQPRACKPLPETLAAIQQADLITLGPGSLFTSVVPNLLVEGIAPAIRCSPALKAYFVNLMWQPGETFDFRASDHIAALNLHAGMPLIDVAIVNTRAITARQRRRYAAQHVRPVINDVDRLSEMGLQVVATDLLASGESVRHDPRASAEVALQLAKRGRAGRSKIRVLGER
ncbi:MAG: uridine diphosphate-N-acetylglucosamine-binding protein YvcK [Bryobacterales bacterium]|nr:uridine diphosphate-N-acetylglucosamine-binding protein YvcK [Bryobacterales bacterium]